MNQYQLVKIVSLSEYQHVFSNKDLEVVQYMMQVL